MPDEAQRSRAAREAAESALVRVIQYYGDVPEFVVLGGLVPELLCAGSEFQHAGTTDIDVQVDLEIACGSVNTKRLERALRDANFEPEDERGWQWVADGHLPRTVVKFELLADLESERADATVLFEGCDRLGAVNLRGTGVVLHNDAGGPFEAAEAVRGTFPNDLAAMRTALDDLRANFNNPGDQGTRAYVEQMLIDYPDLDSATTAADAIVAVENFHTSLFHD